MKLCGISTSLFYLFILLKPLYIFPSGSVGMADIFLMLSFLTALLGKKRSGQGIRLFREDVPFYLFLGFVVLINGCYYVHYGNREFLLYTMYWVYSAAAIWTFRVLYSHVFMRGVVLACSVNILVQAAVLFSGQGRYFHESWGGSRFMGTFNDPNQFAFFLFTMFLVLFMAYCRRNRNGSGDTRQQILLQGLFFLMSALVLFLIGCSKSTGVFLGLLVFFFVLLWQWLWDRMRHSGRRLAWQLGVIGLAVAGGILLWQLWPSADFDISKTDYSLISRVQQKIWKLSNGNLADLLYDRSAERLVLESHYLLFGAGEGYFERFIPWGFEARLSPGVFHVFHVNEIHSSFFDVWFSYGLIPMALLTYWIMKHAVRCSRRQRAAVIALLAESFTLMNLRQPFFWFILVLAGIGTGSALNMNLSKKETEYKTVLTDS